MVGPGRWCQHIDILRFDPVHVLVCRQICREARLEQGVKTLRPKELGTTTAAQWPTLPFLRAEVRVYDLKKSMAIIRKDTMVFWFMVCHAGAECTPCVDLLVGIALLRFS